MRYDVIVVGCGPAGAFTARLLGEYGYKVLILEEHEQVGEPVKCAGLVSGRALEMAGAGDDIILNRLSGARVISPRGTSLDINTGQVHALAVDRAALDRALCTKAQEAGAELITGARLRNLVFTGNGYRVEVEHKGRRRTYETRLVIGADGVNSTTARCAGLQEKNALAVMYSAEAEMERKDDGMVDIFVGQELSPGWFGWIIPLDGSRCRVGAGYALCRPGHAPRSYFKRIVSRFPEYFKQLNIYKYTGGVVPLGMKQKIYTDHLMLVGDAASQVKPVSGGGIYLALQGAQLCAGVASQSLQQNNLNERSLLKYQLLWEEEFGTEIQSGLDYRESYLGFKDRDIEHLLRFLKKPYWRSVIARHGDIDYPSRLASRLFKAGPWMQKFVKATAGMANYTESIKKGVKNVFT